LDAVVKSYYTDGVNISDTSDKALQLQDDTAEYVTLTDIKNENIRDDRIASAEQLFILGHCYQTEGQNEEAIKSYEQAVQIADEIDHNETKAEAHQHLGNVFTGTSEYKKAIEHYKKARKIFPGLKSDEMELIANQWLGYNHLQAGQYQESIEYYNEVVTLASQLGCKTREVNANMGLGSAFSYIGNFEFSEEYFVKSIILAELCNDKGLEREAHTNLGHIYYKSCKFDAAVKSYIKVQEMSHDLGERKAEANACLMLGHTFRQLKQHEKAIESYLKALNINKEREDKGNLRNSSEKAQEAIIIEWCGYCCSFIAGQHQEAITFYEKTKEIAKQVGEKYQEYRTNQAIGNIVCNIGNYAKAKEYYQEALTIAMELGDRHCEGTSCLNLASVCSKDCDYEIAVEWYEKAADSLKIMFNDHVLKKKAHIGLSVAWFNLGNTKKAIELIRRVKKFATEQTVQDHSNVDLTHQRRKSGKEISSLQTSDSRTETEMKGLQTAGPVTEWVNLADEKACYSSRREQLPNEDLARLEKHIKEFHRLYVYTHRASSQDTFTEKLRKSMTRNVKSSAYRSMLNSENRDKFGKKDGKFVRNDKHVFNFAKEDLLNNSSTKMPARLLEPLSFYSKSIGQISCGTIQGTCWLVRDTLVITNHHVYMMINTEREKLQIPNLPITVTFDYLHPGQREHVVTVEVDEERDPQLESCRLDYKFLRLKENECLGGRVPLGPIVRSGQLQEGLVTIVGHPAGSEMHVETCVVVQCWSWREKLVQRHEVYAGLHMTNAELLDSTERYKGCLPHDTSLFTGASGSPVFDLNGNIVALHTQGYTLNVEDGQCSLMEFGVQFNAICDDMERRHIDVKEFFPNHNLDVDEQSMNQDPNEETVSEDPYGVTQESGLIAGTKRKYTETKQKHEDAQQEHEDAQQEHKDAKREHEDAQQEHEDAKQEHEDAQQEHEDVKHEHENAQHEHEDAQQEHEDAKQEHEDAKQEHGDAQQEHEDVKQQHENAQQEHEDAKQKQETEPKHEEINQNEKYNWFKTAFLDSRHKVKKDIHQKLRSFPWLCGAYGQTGPNKEIDRPHIFLTVQKGVDTENVLRDLKKEFNCDNPREYFELLQEPDKKPKIKFLGGHRNGSIDSESDESGSVESGSVESGSVESGSVESESDESGSSTSSTKLVAPGGGVISGSCRFDNVRNLMRVPEEGEKVKPEIHGTGTLTLLCYKNGQHYALTCFHVGCANDENSLNDTIKKKDDIQKIRRLRKHYAAYAKKQDYYFQKSPVENNNELFGDDGSNYECLGHFDRYCLNDECDIMSLKIADGVEIDCKVVDVTRPDWDEVWNDLHNRVVENPGQNPVDVNKVGFKTGETQGYIVELDFSYGNASGLEDGSEDGSEDVSEDVSFHDATVVKGCSGLFLEGGDSGSPVFFHDKDKKKQVFAYGVFEMDELQLPQQHDATKSTGPYYICFNLETALEALELKEAACFGVCSGNGESENNNNPVV
ncbi:tetratricopeptide repeat, partial [Paramuricea clavata]